MSKYTAVIFDLDGTIADGFDNETGEYIDIHAKSWKRAVEHFGFVLDDADYYNNVRGKPVFDVNAYFAETYPLEEGQTVSEFKHKLHRSETMPKYLAYLPTVEATLEKLQSDGLKVAIVTNAMSSNAYAAADQLGFRKIFEPDIITLDDVTAVGEAGKPDPFGLLQMCERLNVSTQEALFVGDTPVDMETGVNAGVEVVGVVHGSTAEQLQRAGATYVVEQMDQILDLLQ